MSASSLPPWDQLSFTFGWDDSIESSRVIPQCMNVTFQYWNSLDGNQIATPPPTPPYSAVMYVGGYQPYVISMNNTAATGKSRWVANLPTGPSFAVSMKDSKGYTGGILDRTFSMGGGSGCNLVNPLKPASLKVNITGTSQCGRAIVSIEQGTAPYTMEVVPVDDRQQKTMYFASSPFAFVLDMSEGVQYFLAVYDSSGRSAVMGSYNITSSSDNSCLGAATTVTAGKFSTLYPGGTTLPTSASSASASASAAPAKSGGLSQTTAVGMAVGISFGAVVILVVLLWLFCRRCRRRPTRPEIDTPQAGYAPFAASQYLYPNSYTDPNQNFLNPSGRQYFPEAIPYSAPTSEGQTTHSIENTSTSEPSTPNVLWEKRRHLVNPDLLGMGPVEVEPFDPNTIQVAGQRHSSGSHAGLPPLPPAYTPSL